MSNSIVDPEDRSRDRGGVVDHALNNSGGRLIGCINNGLHNKNTAARLLAAS